MKWVKESEVKQFIDSHNYDIRVFQNARWIDQKCTPDVVTTIADCIYNYIEDHGAQEFSSSDIWHNQYTVENVENIYKKPKPDEKKASSEYDKFFQQPMELMAYAGILNKCKRGGKNRYSVQDDKMLSFLMYRERNALIFLQYYIEKVLKDSGLYDGFQRFFEHPSKKTYQEVKEEYKEFTISWTKINKPTECFRIFIKILNPLAYKYNTRGTEKGRISQNKITYDMLMYNRDNFRDRYSSKPKDLTRKEYEKQVQFKPNANYTKYESAKAKKMLRAFNDAWRAGKSEVSTCHYTEDAAIHIHHIFSEADFPEISKYPENLIALTPTQHLNYAHPLGKTQVVDRSFQKICLLAKARSIYENLTSDTEDSIYEFQKFMYILSVGLEEPEFLLVSDMDFQKAAELLEHCYQ